MAISVSQMAFQVKNTFIDFGETDESDDVMSLRSSFHRQISDPIGKSYTQDTMLTISEADAWETGSAASSADASSEERSHGDHEDEFGAEHPWERHITNYSWAADEVPQVGDVDQESIGTSDDPDASCGDGDSVMQGSNRVDSQHLAEAVDAASCFIPPSAGQFVVPMLFAVQPQAQQAGGGLTLMVRNVPNKYTRDLFMTELNQTGYQGCFDFFYMPIDPDTCANKGYAFINFIHPCVGEHFMNAYEGRRMAYFDSNKRVTVTRAVLQGFLANYAHYSGSYTNRLREDIRPFFMWQPCPGMEGAVVTAASGLEKSSRRRKKCSLIDEAEEKQGFNVVGRSAKVLIGKSAPSAPRIIRSSGRGKAPVLTGAKSEVRIGAASDVSASSKAMCFCPFCGVRMQDHFKFCQGCGNSLEGLRACN